MTQAILYCTAIVAIVPAGAAFAAQDVFRTETRLVEVPVVVVDKKTGKPVADLTVSDFELMENGKKQEIEFFTLDVSRKLGITQPPEAARPRESGRVFTNRGSSEATPAPLVAVLIDGFNARFEERYYAARAASEVIESSAVGARWGLYLLSGHGIRVLHDYSDNTESLVRRLRELRDANGPAAILNDAGESVDRLGGRTGSPVLAIPNQASRHEFYLRMLTTLWALRGIAHHLSGLPGRKSLIWLTAGLSLNSIIGLDSSLWYRTLDMLNDANVAVYAVDSAGVRTNQNFLAERPTGRTLPGPIFNRPNMDTHVLLGIAESTGGRAFLGSNDLAKAVRSAVADSEVVYRLAYRPSHGKWQGRYVPLRVRVKRRGVEVRHRAGYVARPLDELKEMDRDRVLEDVIVSPLDALGIELSVRVESPTGEDNQEETTVIVKAAAGSVTLVRREERYIGKFDVRFAQRTADGQVLEDFTDEVPLDLTEEDALRTQVEGFAYRRRIDLMPGVESLRIALLDGASGRVGSVLAPVR